MSGNVPLVSIVIPTRNGASTLPALLDAVGRQRTVFRFEVVAVDSSSTDATQDILRGRVDRLLTIEAGVFNHGLTRNFAIAQTRGELIVLLVQDAVPVSDNWLANLTAPLLKDAQLAGVFGRQVACDDASALTREYLSRWVASAEERRTQGLDDSTALDRLAPAARLNVCAFDNVCSCLRRSIWMTHPFRGTPIAEDLEWAREVLLAGYRIAFVPDAIVRHSHERSARYEFARTYLLHRRLYELFQLRTIPAAPDLVRAVGSSLVRHARLGSGFRGATLAFAWPLGQYLGGLSAARGWKPVRWKMI